MFAGGAVILSLCFGVSCLLVLRLLGLRVVIAFRWIWCAFCCLLVGWFGLFWIVVLVIGFGDWFWWRLVLWFWWWVAGLDRFVRILCWSVVFLSGFGTGLVFACLVAFLVGLV